MSGERGKRLATYYGARYGDRTAGELNASARMRAELFASWIGTGKRLLELGCGSGSLLEAYAEGNRVTAMDIDTPALGARRQRLGVETVWGDFATELPFADGSVDVVVAGETLEHMPYPPVFLGEVRRVLAAGGLFAGSVPNAYRYRNRLRVLSGKPIDTDSNAPAVLLAGLAGRAARRELHRRGDRADLGTMVGARPSLFAHRFAWRCRR